MLNTLGTAQSGLSTSQIAIENTMNNIANENTEGYIKRVANLSEVHYDDNSYGNGVEISSIERQTNEYLFKKIVDESSMESYYDKASDIYGLAETIFTETEDSGLSKDLDNYFQAVEDLRSNPSNAIYQANLEQSAQTLVSNMQDLYSDIENLEASLNSQVYDEVDSVNNLLSEITAINEDILVYGTSPELLDKRDSLEKELASYVDIKVTNGEYYKLEIAGETAIFNNTQSYEFEVVESPTTQEDIYDTTQLDDSNFITGDTITLTLNNTTTVSITADTTGLSDWDVKQQIADAINSDSFLNDTLTATVDSYGKLIIESNTQGESSSFDLSIVLEDSSTKVSRSESLSSQATNDVHIEVLDEELSFSSGSLKALTENLTTNSGNNVLSDYKQALDDIAYALVDMTASYVNEGDSYLYGDDTTQTYTGTSAINSINLFSGSSVMSMEFNSSTVNSLTQDDLDYLSTLQWKDDINIDSNNSSSLQSFSQSLQELRVDIASNKEGMDFKLDTQQAINISLQSSYDQITKVDSDEEMINLMQYQAAYEANAKVITTIDEMLQTLLNM